MTLILRDTDNEHYLAARLEGNGPIIDSVKINGFWLLATVDGRIYHVDTLEDGSKVLENRLIAGYLPSTVTVRLSGFAGGVVFEATGGNILYRTAENFDELGECIYRMIAPPGTTYVGCHHVEAYQDGVRIGRVF